MVGYIGRTSSLSVGETSGVLSTSDIYQLRRDGLLFRNRVVYSTIGDASFVVPSGITRVYVKAWGAGGGGSRGSAGAAGADGAAGSYIAALADVTPGETLTVRVGGGGVAADGAFGGTGGSGGGGAGGSGSINQCGGGGGGGLSGLLRGSTALVVAGGGGGGGGRITGSAAVATGAGAFFATALGGTEPASPGALNRGGRGGVGTNGSGNTGGQLLGASGVSSSNGGSGGGGGGYYGGGSGGLMGNEGGGGAGGSCFPLNTDALRELIIPGVSAAAVNTSDVDYAPVRGGAGGLGAAIGNNNATAGTAGIVVLYY